MLMSPVWLFPLVNPLAVSIVTKKSKNASFLYFDSECVMLQYSTLKTMYFIGFWFTCVSAGCFVLDAVMRKRQAKISN